MYTKSKFSATLLYFTLHYMEGHYNIIYMHHIQANMVLGIFSIQFFELDSNPTHPAIQD